jgi:hypothetical protein
MLAPSPANFITVSINKYEQTRELNKGSLPLSSKLCERNQQNEIVETDLKYEGNLEENFSRKFVLFITNRRIGGRSCCFLDSDDELAVCESGDLA